jgi:hypothetical protein
MPGPALISTLGHGPRTTEGVTMSNHFSAAKLKHPGDDARLDLTGDVTDAAAGADLTAITEPARPYRIDESRRRDRPDGDGNRLEYQSNTITPRMFFPARMSA